MANYRSAHPTRPGATAQRSLPGHHGHHAAGAVVRHAHTSVAGSGPKHHDMAKSAAARAAANKAADAKYFWAGKFDPVKLRAAFLKEFSKVRNFDPAVVPHMEMLVGFMAADPKITDVRWMAYMLATAYWETTTLEKEVVPRLGKKHQPLRDKHGKILVRTVHRWLVTMAPVTEVGHGRGRAYHLPVKVESLPNGEAHVIEEDGDEFTVTAKGGIKALTKGAHMGAPATQHATKAYTDDKNKAHAYYGRGYVQLTWWSNYAKAGVELGLGLQLLLNPDEVLKPTVAYRLMAYGMRTGQGFANGHKFTNYFNGTKTDYVNARHMVNGHDHAADIAHIAVKFAAVLLAAKS